MRWTKLACAALFTAIVGLASVGLTPGALAQSRNETLLVVTESGRTAWTSTASAPTASVRPSWNLYDRLLTYGVKTLPDGTKMYDYTELKPELAESWQVAPDGMSVTFKLRQDAQVPRRHAGDRQRREVVVRPRGHRRRLSDLPDEGGLAREARAVRGRRRPDVPHQLPAQGQADDARPRRAGARHHQLRAREEARHGEGSVGDGVAQEQRRRAAARTSSSRGSPASRPSTRASTTGVAARCRSSGGSIVREVPSAGNRRALLERGDVDIVVRPAAARISPRSAKAGKLKVVGMPVENALSYVGMNVKDPPFDNVKVRQAVAYAIPYEKIMDAAIFGRGIQMYGAEPGKPTTAAGRSPARTRPTSPRRKALLAEAGHGQRLREHAVVRPGLRHRRASRRPC